MATIAAVQGLDTHEEPPLVNEDGGSNPLEEVMARKHRFNNETTTWPEWMADFKKGWLEGQEFMQTPGGQGMVIGFKRGKEGYGLPLGRRLGET